MGVFKELPKEKSLAKNEEEVLQLWEKTKAFERSISKRSNGKSYVFYDGPPFATGLPHYGHLVASTIKDVVARYWTMRGHPVERRFGWDTHGLPIEMETEKKLGLSGPGSIREYGVDKFNEACRSSVLKYTKEWRKTIGRVGRWVDFDNDYKTMDPKFMESVWWVFGELWKKDLVYKGNRVMPFSWRLSTSLSNFEANLDYRDVQDPALTIRLPLVDDPNTNLLIWTTTPWTLPSNLAVAVGKDVDYVKASIENEDGAYIVAKDLAEKVLGKEYKILSEMKGSELVGKAYKPLLNYFKTLSKATSEHNAAFVVIPSAHVTTDSGTGLVHMAPAFGQDDFDVCQKEKLPLVDPVDEEGNFTKLVPDFEGQNIKEADPKIIRKLKEMGSVFKHETIQHSYPFCWRSGTPLIYKALPVWFVKVRSLRDKLVKHNESIHWVPESVGKKRFSNWLADAQDWAISRSRFWGTPIPIWTCSDCDERRCISSIDDLESISGQSVSDLHSHFIDSIHLSCEKCSGNMERIPEVFDCWFDAGSMPYAQNHYPFADKEKFEEAFPADFIAEGLDQTRGWFYTLLVLSTALFDKPPFKNVIVNGMVLAADGAKMSKSKQNYPDPTKVLNELSADALRAYLINSPVVRAEPLAFTEQGVKDIVRMVMLPLSNAWGFFTQYANIDGWDPKENLGNAPEIGDRREIDRWILSKLQSLISDTNKEMEGYYLYKVVPPMLGFIDDLTNWYIRRCRRRFWKNAITTEDKQDKSAAYATLYEVLTTFSKVLAPALPFISERLYQNLVVETGYAKEEENSVHLCDYPTSDSKKIDSNLESEIELVRQIVKMGRALRERTKIRVKQPLECLAIVTHVAAEISGIQAHKEVIEEELNIKKVQVTSHDDELCELQFKPNFKTLGRRMGKDMREASRIITGFSREDFNNLEKGLEIEVCGKMVMLEDVEVIRKSKEGMAVETEGHLTVGLDTEISEALELEGLAREIVSQLQKSRKDLGFKVTDRVQLTWWSADQKLIDAMEQHQAYIQAEILASDFSRKESEGLQEFQLSEMILRAGLKQ